MKWLTRVKKLDPGFKCIYNAHRKIKKIKTTCSASHISPVAGTVFYAEKGVCKMNSRYPQNLREGLILGVVVCAVMVAGMMSLNLWIHGVLTLGSFIRAFPPIFITAFMLDLLFVGPIVRRLQARFNIGRYMPLLRVAMMAGAMTFLAPLVETGHVIPAHYYLAALPRNYVAALLLQIFVAMRFGLFVLGGYRTIKSKMQMTK